MCLLKMIYYVLEEIIQKDFIKLKYQLINLLKILLDQKQFFLLMNVLKVYFYVQLLMKKEIILLLNINMRNKI